MLTVESVFDPYLELPGGVEDDAAGSHRTLEAHTQRGAQAVLQTQAAAKHSSSSRQQQWSEGA